MSNTFFTNKVSISAALLCLQLCVAYAASAASCLFVKPTPFVGSYNQSSAAGSGFRQAPQVIDFPALPVKLTCDLPFSAGATSNNPGNKIVLSSSNPAVAVVDASGNIFLNGPGTTNITAMQPATGVYTEATPVTRVLTVKLPEAPHIFITEDTKQACQGSLITVTATVEEYPASRFNFQWKIIKANAGTNTAFIRIGAINENSQVWCEITDKLGCLPPATSNIVDGLKFIPYVTPTISISVSPTTPACAGGSVTFTATTTNKGTDPTYQWLVNGIAAGTNSATFTTTQLQNNDVVSCRLTNNDGPCVTVNPVVSNLVTVTVLPAPNPLPTVSISLVSSGEHEGSVATFAAQVQNGGSGLTYQWLVNGIPAGVNSPTFSSSNLRNNSEVICVVTGNLPCNLPTSSNIIKMSLLPALKIIVPNLFTPNGDGVNDTWGLTTLVSFPDCQVSVYSRYGQQVYNSVGYNKPWDGTSQGTAVPSGVYYYVINPGNRQPLLSGAVTIVR